MAYRKNIQTRSFDTPEVVKKDDKPKEKKKKLDEFITLDISAISVDENIRQQYENDPSIDELAESMRHFGQLHPVKIYEKSDNEYKLIFGHRRYFALLKIGAKNINCVLNDKPDETDTVFIQIIENEQRQNVQTKDLEKAVKKLKDKFGYTAKEIAKKIGKSESYVYDLLRALPVREEYENDFNNIGVDMTNYDTQALAGKSKEKVKEAIEMVKENPDKKHKIIKKLKSSRNNSEKERRERIDTDFTGILDEYIGICIIIDKNFEDNTVKYKAKIGGDSIKEEYLNLCINALNSEFEKEGYKILKTADDKLFEVI